MRGILIVEPGHSGHLYVYVKLLAEWAKSQGLNPVLLLREEGRGSPEHSTHLSAVIQEVEVHYKSAISLKDVKATAERVGAAHIVIPHGDPFVGQALKMLRWDGTPKTTLLIMRDPRWEHPGSIRRRIRLIAKLAAIRLLSMRRQVEIVWLRAPCFAQTARERAAPDPVLVPRDHTAVHTGAAHVRGRLGMTDDVFWFGMVGSLTPRKNLSLVVASLEALSHLKPKAFGFALIGPQHSSMPDSPQDIEALARNLPFPMVIDNRVLTNDELNEAVATLDCLVMAYSSEAPNSTLAKSVALGVRVAAAGSTTLAGFVSDLGRGPTAKLDVASLTPLLMDRMDQTAPSARADLGWEEFCATLIPPTS